MPDTKSGGGGEVVRRSITSAEAIKKMEKELYREALMKDHDLKRGSKYPPMSIEPFPYERARLSGDYTDADRALRKQWMQDQILTDREPVHVERWVRRNVFRRLWNAPFNAIERAMSSAGAPAHLAYSVRFGLPKLVGGLAVVYALWFHLKVAPRTWEAAVGLDLWQTSAYSHMCVPGTAEWRRMMNGGFYRAANTFANNGFQQRQVLLDQQLVTSAAGEQLDGSVN